MTHYQRVPLRNGRPKRPVLPSWLLGVLLAGFALVAMVSAVLVFTTVRDFVAGWKITSQNPATPVAQSESTSSPTDVGVVLPVATPKPGDTAVPTPEVGAWTGTDRVTILIMGIDRRQGEEEKGYLTDTMMLVTMDPSAHTAAMLSIPRDLWVSIPGGFEEDTINTANRTGDYYDYPGGGPALAVKTVEYNLGVTVNYYVRLDFTAFETFIDTIGGIDVYNETEIDDPNYPNGSYGFEPFFLPAGPQHLNGHDALRYARTRHGNSDIDRATRQQQVAMAVRERVLSLDMLPSLVAGAPNLMRTLNDSIWTNLSLEQMVSLALLAQDIPRENIRTAVIDFKYVLDYTTPEGRQVLVPLRDKIRVLRDELFASTAAMAPATAEDEKSLMLQEEATVQVLNGAGIDGLGCLTQQFLIDQGVHADQCDTADRSDYTSSVIVDYTGNPYTVRFLSKIFGVSTIISGADPNSNVDVKVIVGQDWTVPVN
jgi:polyisoprenyl-teichoic acid--peptidoglycan teichoic acid transferase